MRKWKVLLTLVAVALVVPSALGQDDLQRQMNALAERVKAVEAENAELRDQLSDQDDAALESQINALMERYAGTTVNSVANPVTLTGVFRFRNTWQLGERHAGYSYPKIEGTPTREYEEVDGAYTDALMALGFMYEFTRDVTAFAQLVGRWTFGDAYGSHTGGPGNFSGLAGGGGMVRGGYGNRFHFKHGDAAQSVSVLQAWIEVRNVFNQPQLSTKTGRQFISLGNQFQFGVADWYNWWAFDGTTWTWDDESFRLTALVLKLYNDDVDLNQVPSLWGNHDNDELYGLYFTLKTIENHELDLYWIYINGHGNGNSMGALGHNVGGGGYATGNNAYFHTIGARIGGEFPDVAAGLDWNLEFAYQFGDSNLPWDGDSSADIEGWALEAELGVTFTKDSKFRVYLRFLWASGPDLGDDGMSLNDSGYIPLYPNRHSNWGFRARYGLFDLIPMTNVLTLQGGFHFDPDPAWTLGATILWATTDEADTWVDTDDDDYGWEIDVWGEYRYSEQLKFGAGIGILFPDEEGEALWGLDDDTHFLFYLQALLVF